MVSKTLLRRKVIEVWDLGQNSNLAAIRFNSDKESVRVEVYPVTQQYWDIAKNDTLGGIAAKLLPNNPEMQLHLMDDLIRLNPKAFINNNKNLIIAGTRLWLPGKMTQADTKVDKKQYDVKSFSWGNIKTPRNK